MSQNEVTVYLKTLGKHINRLYQQMQRIEVQAQQHNAKIEAMEVAIAALSDTQRRHTEEMQERSNVLTMREQVSHLANEVQKLSRFQDSVVNSFRQLAPSLQPLESE